MSHSSQLSAGAPVDERRLTPYALTCVALLTVLGFSLGCSEFVVIGIEPELSEALWRKPLGVWASLSAFFSVAYAVLYHRCLPSPQDGSSASPYSWRTRCDFHRRQRGHGLCAHLRPSCWASRVLLGAVSGALLAVGVTYIPELVGVKRTSLMISIVYAGVLGGYGSCHRRRASSSPKRSTGTWP